MFYRYYSVSTTFWVLFFMIIVKPVLAQTPQVIATIPELNALNVLPATNIYSSFDVGLDPTTINATTVIVHGSQTGTKEGMVQYDSNLKRIDFIPGLEFKPGEVVKVMLTNNIKSSGGIPLHHGFSWEFTVHSAAAGMHYDLEHYDAGMFAHCLYVGDLDTDTDIDLAVAESTAPGNLFIYLNDGAADFTLKRIYSRVYYPTHIIGCDLDGDGDLDLATSNHDSDNSGFTVVWRNTGAGFFELTQYYGYANDFGHSWLCSHDFDGDGDLDLAATIGTAGKVSVLLNNGAASFSSPTIYDAGGWPKAIVCPDLDRDGDMDLAVVNRRSNNVSVFANTAGQFRLIENYLVGTSPDGICAADFNGDGHIDLATANLQSDDVSLLVNNGEGTFGISLPISVPSRPQRIIAADFDGDADQDIAITTSSNIVHLLINNGTGVFTNGPSFFVGNDPTSIQAADLNDDGILDLVTANSDFTGTISVLINTGFSPVPRILAIRDVTDDQGHQVCITWRRSLYDASNSDTSITYYSLWRRIDEPDDRKSPGTAPAFNWQFGTEDYWQQYDVLSPDNPYDKWQLVADIDAERQDEYDFIANTLKDSTHNGIYWSVFYISAHTEYASVFFNSKADSGYSVDNLAPRPPALLKASREDDVVKLWWQRNPETDLAHYAIYRSTWPGFNPDTTAVLATTIDTIFIDFDADNAISYYYRIAAFDIAGNRSLFSNEVHVAPTWVNEMQKMDSQISFNLFQNYPNPFNPRTTISYQVAKTGWTTLTIYDLLGQEILALVHEEKLPGSYTISWDGKDANGMAVASGIYVYRLQAKDFNNARKLILLK